MAYTPYIADWKDFPNTSTPITEAALEHVESGLVAAAATADAAVPKSTVTTKGDLIVGTAAANVARLAVGSQGRFPISDSNASTGIKWTGGFSTSLPGGPVDGEEVILVDSLTVPTYLWHLKYIDAATTYKWYCIGGTAAVAYVATSETISSSAYGDLATVGPDFTTPVAGDWHITCGCAMVNSGNASKRTGMSYAVGATAASEEWGTNDGGYAFTDIPNGSAQERTFRHTGVPASSLIRAKYRGGDGVEQGRFQYRQIRVLPFRVN